MKAAIAPMLAFLLVLVVVALLVVFSSPTKLDKNQAAIYDACLSGEWGRCRQCAIEDPSRDRRAACVTLLLFDKRREE